MMKFGAYFFYLIDEVSLNPAAPRFPGRDIHLVLPLKLFFTEKVNIDKFNNFLRCYKPVLPVQSENR